VVSLTSQLAIERKRKQTVKIVERFVDRFHSLDFFARHRVGDKKRFQTHDVLLSFPLPFFLLGTGACRNGIVVGFNVLHVLLRDRRWRWGGRSRRRRT
jgi:hypothetical protein